jgi:hypothetical protein
VISYSGAVLYDNPVFAARSWVSEWITGDKRSLRLGDKVIWSEGRVRCPAVVLAVSPPGPNVSSVLVLLSLQSGHVVMAFVEEVEPLVVREIGRAP